ncbi:MAG TPA: DMT family transporter [Hyphomicrobiaceae bacterium]|jgi:drug/metabolite transporter (DMT)-like permease|nr:DMT family transporter [Hyphomicrobiaceae bacterium]
MPTPVWKPLALVPASGPVAGVVWVTISMALFGALAAFARGAMNAGLHPFEVVFLRNLLATLMLSPLLLWRGASLLRSSQLSLYGLRVLVSLLSMQAWFYALALIPIGEVTAISFLAPVFGTLGAILLLGERVRLRRWTAIMVGFLGAMVILRPGMAPLGIGQLCAVFNAMSIGIVAVMIKQLTTVDDPDKIVFLTNLMLTPLSLAPALLVWTWPSPDALLPVLGLGLTAVLGHVALVRGYAATDASLAMTFEFSRLPFSVAIAYFAFGETIDRWTWVGAAIIFASAVYITRREARLAAARRAAARSSSRGQA